ncbi:GlsB/YeaQ/YmgE family stress response membrane protein [Altererythrobacter sp. ZODW24]|uniref:GlsB/YeaQ/YmgE family stress response membrane protein n=1 Tax=Altererythrobacter sp. ZODW24 TaxID=2185142 RepID=UPI000DF7B914|nr:GlsB/YeaQ/YmgE family stress response membrane protein [Altererythrobacter sp. ZODW24]
MGLLILIVAGGVLGWLAAILAQIEDDQRILQNIVAGIAGSLLAGLLANSESLIGAVSADSLLWSVLGALGATALVHQLRNRLAR